MLNLGFFSKIFWKSGPRCTHLYEVETNILVERVESQFRQSMIAPRSVHKQELVQKSELHTNTTQSINRFNYRCNICEGILPTATCMWNSLPQDLDTLPTLSIFKLSLKINTLSGIADMAKDDFFSFSTCTLTRGHKYKLCKKTDCLTYQTKHFNERVINAWNSLPVNIVDSG